MNCQSFENIVNELAREQLIEAGLRDEAAQHTEQCSKCAGRLEDELNLTINLRALATEMEFASAPASIESDLLTAFNERNVPTVPRWYRRYSTYATAAGLLLALAIGIAAWKLTSPTDQKKVAVIPEPTKGEPQPTDLTATAKDVQSQSNPEIQPVVDRRQDHLKTPKTARRTRQVEETRSQASQSELATDFMPIGYVSSASLQDGGSVVRVELPRSTIISMGFAVNMDRYSERVKADVLLGADGLARAIRFVE